MDSLKVKQTAAPVREQVIENLRDAILSSELKPGDRLIERELIEATGVSRTSVREALRQLESEGLVVSVPNKGPIVARTSAAQASDIYEVRAVLEGLAGRLAAERASDSQRAKLTAAMERCRDVGDDPVRLLEAKARFYAVLLSMAENAQVERQMRSLNARITFLRRMTMGAEGRVVESLRELEAIHTAVVAGDASAAWTSCVAHVESAAKIALELLEADENPE